MKNLIGYVLLLLSLYLGMPNAIPNVFAASDIDSELITKTESGITYAIGGIGEEQRKALKSLRKDFNLQLTFSEKPTGTYLADVDVTIQTVSGKEILELSDVGPIFLVQLDPGNYQIRAEFGGKVQKKTVHLHKKGRIKDLYFYW